MSALTTVDGQSTGTGDCPEKCPNAVDNAFPVSVGHETITARSTTNKSAPERSWNSIAQGPRRPVKEHDRLMETVEPTSDNVTPRCPRCGRPASRSSLSGNGGVLTRHHLDEAGHIWLERWAEVA